MRREINTNEFIEVTELLRNIFITDLHYILYNLKDRGFISYKNEDRLYNCGFLQRKKMDPFIRMSSGGGFGDDSGRDRMKKEADEKLIRHLENPYIITSIGKKLIEILTN